MTDNYTASASVIGRELGKNRTEMTKALLEHDLITGKPGARELTDKGKAIGGMVKSWDNGYGGFAARGYDYLVWDRDGLVNELKKPVVVTPSQPLTTELAAIVPLKSEPVPAIPVKESFITTHKTAIVIGCALIIVGGITFYVLAKKAKASEVPEDED